jgi:hypothetical protein
MTIDQTEPLAALGAPQQQRLGRIDPARVGLEAGTIIRADDEVH